MATNEKKESRRVTLTAREYLLIINLLMII